MDTLLADKGFKEIIHYKSGSEAYPKCLAIALKQILLTYIDEPFLLLEDDIEMNDRLEFTIPEKADAIYFGLSLCASHPVENYNVYYAKFEPYTHIQARVINMLGGHAIFYITRAYKEALIERLDGCIKTSGHTDIAMTKLQQSFNIYANKIPTFYQSNKFNTMTNGFDVEEATKIQIMDDLSLTKLK
jgi:hypothetical protein